MSDDPTYLLPCVTAGNLFSKFPPKFLGHLLGTISSSMESFIKDVGMSADAREGAMAKRSQARVTELQQHLDAANKKAKSLDLAYRLLKRQLKEKDSMIEQQRYGGMSSGGSSPPPPPGPPPVAPSAPKSKQERLFHRAVETVKTALSNGISKDDITKFLLNQGLSPDQIQTAIDAAG